MSLLGIVSKKEISGGYLNSEDRTKNREKIHRNSENRYDCSIYENMFEKRMHALYTYIAKSPFPSFSHATMNDNSSEEKNATVLSEEKYRFIIFLNKILLD